MIEMNKLNFSYRQEDKLFSALDLILAEGSICGLLGKNGAGKTSLLKLMAGLLFVTSGECQIMEYNPRKRHPNFLSQIYFIPEDFYVPALSVKEYVNLYAPFYENFDRKLFDHCLDEFNLPYDKPLSILSYGQKKKFLIAFGLAANTKLLILDEPTNGLDIPSKSQFRKLVASSAAKDKLFIISTHQVRDVENLVDRLVILDEAKIVFNYPMEKISKSLSFEKESSEPNNNSSIYYEKCLGGFNVVNENSSGIETAVDFELLFSAVLQNTQKIKLVLQGDK